MTRYAHQQVFSTGAWWDFEEMGPGLWRRVYVDDLKAYLEHGLPPWRIEPVPPATEQATVVAVFAEMLKAVTADGGRKRTAGTKPPWWCDAGHEPAIFSHLSKWKHGERIDHESGAHPLVHLAWRALAIAYQEKYGTVDPEMYMLDDGTCVGRLADLGRLPRPRA